MARSLSLRELHAKSREHGSCGRRRPVLELVQVGLTGRSAGYFFVPLGSGFVAADPQLALWAAFSRRSAAESDSRIGVRRNPSAAEAGGSSRSCGVDEDTPSRGLIEALRRSETAESDCQKSALSNR
jgi:hypothetical protein